MMENNFGEACFAMPSKSNHAGDCALCCLEPTGSDGGASWIKAQAWDWRTVQRWAGWTWLLSEIALEKRSIFKKKEPTFLWSQLKTLDTRDCNIPPDIWAMKWSVLVRMLNISALTYSVKSVKELLKRVKPWVHDREYKLEYLESILALL